VKILYILFILSKLRNRDQEFVDRMNRIDRMADT